jgi:hypothetical protein
VVVGVVCALILPQRLDGHHGDVATAPRDGAWSQLLLRTAARPARDLGRLFLALAGVELEYVEVEPDDFDDLTFGSEPLVRLLLLLEATADGISAVPLPIPTPPQLHSLQPSRPTHTLTHAIRGARGTTHHPRVPSPFCGCQTFAQAIGLVRALRLSIAASYEYTQREARAAGG